MMSRYQILRVMNNNVLLTKEQKTGQEMVLMGKGIGFGKKKGSEIDIHQKEIEKSFVAGNDSLKNTYLKMLEEVNGEIVEVCTEVIMTAEKKFGELGDRSFIVIMDHISFAIEKMKKNIVIDNPFVFEIEQLYPEEYAIGEYARNRIIEVLGIDVTEAEVGFIALHLNAARQHKGVKDALKNTRIIKSMLEIVERELGIPLMENPGLNNRLLLHLRGFIQQMEEQEHFDSHKLFKATIKECAEAYEVARKVGRLLEAEKKISVRESDLFYLTLHVDRLMRKRNNQ